MTRRTHRLAARLAGLCLALLAQSGMPLLAQDHIALPSSQTKTARETPATAIGRTLAGVTTSLNEMTAELDRLEKAVERARKRDAELAAFRRTTEDIEVRAQALETGLLPNRAGVESQVRRLGPPPAKDAPPESDVLKAERVRLNAVLRQINGAIATSTVLQERARQLVRLIQDYRRKSFRDGLFERSASPLSPTLWGEIAGDAGPRFRQLGFLLKVWWKTIRTDMVLAIALLALTLGILLIRWIAARLVVHYRSRGYVLRLDFQGRATSAVLVSLARAIPPVAVAAAVYLAISWFSDLPESFSRIAVAAFKAFAIFAIVRALTWTLLATERSEWRMVPLSNAAAVSVRRLLVTIAAVYAIDLVASELIEIIFAPPPLRITLHVASSLTLAALMFGLFRTRFAPSAETAPQARLMTPAWLKLPLFISAVTIIAAALSGYVNLARFLSSQIVVTGSILVAAILVYFAIGEFSKDVASGRALPDRMLPGEMNLDESARRRSSGVLRGLLTIALGLGTSVLVLLQWGFDWGDLAIWFKTAFFGFEIGAIRISIAAILIGIGLFIAGLFATRLLQRSLANTILSPSRLDAGLAHSIRTGIGYAGFGVSALVAISYAGFNFTNFAIIAGALSVGIGFGLQSIVNNFVSGLILLAERPIQVGDWIVVGDKEGYVRRISVRATVIETFDRASLIIPNSDLMTAAVTNWTYGNRLGRVIVKVGTAYDTDPLFVYETLLDIGRNCSFALANPPPSVVFEDFASSTLNFSLRIYIADINNVIRAQTELRMAIWTVFREKSIDIDFPQLDVHIKRG